jgi:hypothetical protein
MNRYPIHHPTHLTEPVVAACCDDGFGGRTGLRQVLSRLGLHADTTQENTLLELIHKSHSRKQHFVMY